MQTPVILLSGLACAALLGCQSTLHNSGDGAAPAPWVSEAIRRAAVERAIVVQHTLYAYHFVDGSADLNALGAQDLAVLAAHFREHAGELNVRRANTAAALFEARVTAVARALAQAGVPAARVTVADGLPGGDGATSERVIAILAKPSTPLTGTSAGTGTSTGKPTGASTGAVNTPSGGGQ